MIRPLLLAPALFLATVCGAQDEPAEEEAQTGFALAVEAAPAADLEDELKPLMALELGVIKRVVRPTAEQKPKIAAAAQECLANMADMVARNEEGVIEREVVAITPAGLRLSEDPVIRIQNDMVEAIRPLVSDQQHAEYVKEVQQRRHFRRQASVLVAVELLDQHLALSKAQKEEITGDLMEKWDEAESMPIQMYVSNRQYIPPVPAYLVETVLDASQKSIWNSLNQIRFPFYMNQLAANAWDEEFMEAE